MMKMRRVPIALGLIALWLAAPVVLADDADRSLDGDRVCTRCHDETEARPVLAIYKTAHGVKADLRTPGCQSCHGPSVAHVTNPTGASTRPLVDVDFGARTATATEVQVETCLGCHQNGQRTHWEGSQHHASGLACTSCHEVHTHRERVLTKSTQPEVCFTCHAPQRAQFRRVSTHPVHDGEMACSDCHNPHGSLGPKLMVNDGVNETCYVCHAERRGPFLWEHSPVNEDCTICHTPHGSNNTPLLKVRAPWLCQECHSSDHSGPMNSAANLPAGAATTVGGLLPLGNRVPRSQMNGHNCMSCHALVHGSNNPAGARLSK
ncbi:MAG: DmsE family decaheme c-type cytochrome [Steroidobacteraceae bacterium]